MLALKNFGHYWSRDLVDWGTRGRGRQGSLLGATTPGAENAEADFRQQIAIYALFNEEREVVYIGQTGRGNQRLLTRLRQHSRGSMRDRWSNFSWFGFLDVGPTVELVDPDGGLEDQLRGTYAGALDEIEATLIQLIEPRLNKQGPRWGDNQLRTTEYFQYSEREPVSLEGVFDQLLELQRTVAGLAR